MRKIMFDDRYGLTLAVIDRRKTKTRRNTPEALPEFIRNGYDRLEIFEGKELRCHNKQGVFVKFKLPYQIGEVVAVAQRYEDIVCGALLDDLKEIYQTKPTKLAGWANKMFVRADLMPHRICMTNVRVEKLQDISSEDCLAEGILDRAVDEQQYYDGRKYRYGFYSNDPKQPASIFCQTPQGAYADLIDYISGKGTWNRNPWVYVYDYELVK